MKKIIIVLFLLSSFNSIAQENYRSPLNIPIYLSANFAELRPNHFHSGIDLKTEGVINKPVYSIEDGYISRVSVSSSGYGLAIYVTHTTGKTSVYGHLNKFAPSIAEYVINKQYEAEQFNIDITLDKNDFPVKRGDLIAYSGNTGSSFGPHVHFEIRDTETQRVIDPLLYYETLIKDTQPPIIKGIAVYPVAAYGVVNNKDIPFRQSLVKLKNGEYSNIDNTISAWGKIGIGINAIDKMDGTTNVYGVKKVKLLCDGKEIFASDISSFLFEQTRMINSLIDYDYWYRYKAFYMKSFVEPANRLPFYKTVDSGYVTIDKEKDYILTYELEDLYGNTTSYQFTIKGQKMNIPSPRICSQAMVWYQNNYYISDEFSLNVPKEYLYDSIGFVLNKVESDSFLSKIYSVHDAHIPLNGYCPMTLKIAEDTIPNKSLYGIVVVEGNKESWVGGTYKEGYMTVNIRELGQKYAVSYDNKAPVITPVTPQKWVPQKQITIKLSDNKSGIASYRGTIDGQYVLFEKDIKAPAYTYKFDPKRLKKGEKHRLVFTATDRCGNTASYKYEFTY